MGEREMQSIFWVADSNWNITYSCKAYSKRNGEYCKYINRLAKRANMSTDDFALTFSLYQGKKEAVREAKRSFDMNLYIQSSSFQNQTPVVYTNEEKIIIMKQSVLNMAQIIMAQKGKTSTREVKNALYDIFLSEGNRRDQIPLDPTYLISQREVSDFMKELADEQLWEKKMVNGTHSYYEYSLPIPAVSNASVIVTGSQDIADFFKSIDAQKAS